jgi:urate oxidase
VNFTGGDLEDCCAFLATKFLEIYPQVEGIQVSAEEIPYGPIAGSAMAFAPSGPERATARIELDRTGIAETVSGIRGFRLLRLAGSSFQGFVRDEYTTLPDIANRPLHMWLDLEWLYGEPAAAFSTGAIPEAVRQLVRQVFTTFESGSIQQLIYQIGTKMLGEIPAIVEVRLEANNRTWDTVVEHGDTIGVFTDSRPPYGCLGLRLRR